MCSAPLCPGEALQKTHFSFFICSMKVLDRSSNFTALDSPRLPGNVPALAVVRRKTRFMLNKTLLTALVVLLLASCEKERNQVSVSGLYTENAPVAGRSQLNFINKSLVVRSETGSSFRDTFIYSISAGKIRLTPTWTNQEPGQDFDFEKIDDNTIKIQNLYPSFPEAPKSYMTFKK